MAIRSETRTTHTITIDIPDDVLAKIEEGDEVEIMLNGRGGFDMRMPRPMRLSYSWVRYLLSGPPSRY